MNIRSERWLYTAMVITAIVSLPAFALMKCISDMVEEARTECEDEHGGEFVRTGEMRYLCIVDGKIIYGWGGGDDGS